MPIAGLKSSSISLVWLSESHQESGNICNLCTKFGLVDPLELYAVLQYYGIERLFSALGAESSMGEKTIKAIESCESAYSGYMIAH